MGEKKAGLERLGELVGYRVEPFEARLIGQAGELSIAAVSDHVFRLRSARGGTWAEDRSFAVVADRSGKVAPEVFESAEKLELDFGGLRAVAGKKPFALSLYDRDGGLVLRHQPGEAIAWVGEGVRAVQLAEPGTRYHGFGEKTGPLDKRGQALTMWNTDMPYHVKYDPLYVSIPFALAVRGGRAHGLFFDNPSRSSFQVGSRHPWLFSYQAWLGELDLYVITGPGVSDVVQRFAELCGKAPMPPRWALGHHQCRWSYMNEAEVRDVAAGFRERDLPTDVIYLDIHYMDRYRVFTVDRERYPDLGKLTQDLAAQGFKVVTIVDPGVAVAPDYDFYREGRDRGYFCKDRRGHEYRAHVWPGLSAFPDFSEPEVRSWWGDAHRTLTEQGVAGIWNDMNEPSAWLHGIRVKDLVLTATPIRSPRMVHKDGGRHTPHLGFRNLYGLLECEATRDGLKRLRPGKRPFVLTRAGYAGIQRHAAVWTGDNSSNFRQLELSIPMLLNLSLSGAGFCGADIGGFVWSCSPELYARWIQLGAFYPFCRTHSALRTRRQEPWSFGPEVERIARQYLKLRYQLHPTLYSLFHELSQTGAPILRPLFYEFPSDRTAAEVEDQLLFGPSILLAPVVKKGRRQREVYLPEAGWTDYWTGERIDGPRAFVRDAPLELMPIYVREGAALFKWPALSWLDQRPVDRLIIELYPPRSGQSEAELYEDDGESDEHERGVFATRRVVQTRAGSRLVAQVLPKLGPFNPPARQLTMKFRLERRPARVTLDGRELMIGPEAEAAFGLAGDALAVGFVDDGMGHEVVIEL